MNLPIELPILVDADDLIERLERAAKQLQLAAKDAGGPTERTRLMGKRDGLVLAMSYVLEARRMAWPSGTEAKRVAS